MSWTTWNWGRKPMSRTTSRAPAEAGKVGPVAPQQRHEQRFAGEQGPVLDRGADPILDPVHQGRVGSPLPSITCDPALDDRGCREQAQSGLDVLT